MSNYGKIPPQTCSTCGYTLDDATAMMEPDNSKPRTGDLSVCGKCGEILVFQDDLTTKQANVNDMLKLSKRVCWLLEATQKWIRHTRPLDILEPGDEHED